MTFPPQRAFFGDAIDVWCTSAHHSPALGADVVMADIVTPDDEDVGFICRMGQAPTKHENQNKKIPH